MDLQQRISAHQGGFLFFGLTPPRRTATPEQVESIAALTLDRLASLDLDGLILYDIDDESDRTTEERPFPYLPTLDPAEFHAQHLSGWAGPTVIYRCVRKYPEGDLQQWLQEQDTDRVLTVFVGSSSRDKGVRIGLRQAMALRQQQRPDLLLGGVTIPERHMGREDEHQRLLSKQDGGCSFFISQVIYDVNAAKDLVSDYAYTCREKDIDPVPIIFTLSVCGSAKTLAFLQWLGVHVPRWMQNQLRNVDDTLAESYEQCLATAAELAAFCRRLDLPFGFNVESVSIRKAEIEASVALAKEVRALLQA